MSEKIPYLRVGTTYYKTIEKPLISGDKISILVRWNRETIISDHKKSTFQKFQSTMVSAVFLLILTISRSSTDSTICTMKFLFNRLMKI